MHIHTFDMSRPLAAGEMVYERYETSNDDASAVAHWTGAVQMAGAVRGAYNRPRVV
jgi:hypothetical protein